MAHDGQPPTVGELLLGAASAAADADAVVFPGRRWTYGQLAERAGQIAAGLVGLGVTPGEHVGILMANSPEFVASLFGIALAGAVSVPINTRYRAVELPHVVADADLVAILTSDLIDDYVDLLALLGQALPGLEAAPEPHTLRLAAAPRLRSVVVLGRKSAPGTIDQRELEDRARPTTLPVEGAAPAAAPGDIALLLYTSGTTSQPRGCPLTHAALVGNWIAVGQVLRVGLQDRCWAPCPLFHLGGIGPLLLCVANGATFLSDTFFEPTRALELIERERASVLYPAYPPITQGLLSHPRYPDADLGAARVVVNVAPPETLRQMQLAMPQATQLSLYGLTEGGGAVTYNTLDEDLEARLTTCGAPLPGTAVRIADPVSGAALAPGEEGEILIRGSGLCQGYYKDPEKTASALDGDGWFHTGDRGVLDGAGRLQFLGRLKDMLKVGGENVAPAEIEAHLSTHPAVKLVQVVGVPDPRLDEVPAAFVELRPGRQATEAELLDYCRAHIARFKIPRHVRFVSEWPLSATKIQKGPLREQLLRELELDARG